MTRPAPRSAAALPAPGDDGRLVHGSVAVDLVAHDVVADGARVELSHLQFLMLVALVRARGGVVPTAELRRIAGEVVPVTDRTVPSVISRLRARLGERGASIRVVRSRGYRLALPD